jgi:hypothetical protein
MSRFARLHSGPLRSWSPPESPFRIEYSPALLREVRIAGAGTDSFGVLYGVRHGQTIRLVATRGRAGLDPLGIFASRVRGQVFLTEEDLERFDKAEACVALVLSAENGGFFVRDADGSIETVRSYEEFYIDGRPVAVIRKRNWRWALSLALLPLLYFIPRPQPPPIAMSLSEEAGQLRITLTAPTAETLTILDGAEKTSLAMTGQSTITYARRSGDVTVKIGATQARFVGPALPSTEIEQARASVEALKSKIAQLRANRTSELSRIAALERRLQ